MGVPGRWWLLYNPQDVFDPIMDCKLFVPGFSHCVKVGPECVGDRSSLLGGGGNQGFCHEDSRE